MNRPNINSFKKIINYILIIFFAIGAVYEVLKVIYRYILEEKFIWDEINSYYQNEFIILQFYLFLYFFCLIFYKTIIDITDRANYFASKHGKLSLILLFIHIGAFIWGIVYVGDDLYI